MFKQQAFAFCFALLVIGAFGAEGPAQQVAARYRKEAPDPAKWNVSLAGTWEFAPAGSSRFAPARVPGYWSDTPQVKAADWREVLKWKSGTYRRTFQIPPGTVGAAVDFEMVRWGGQAFVNGKSAGEYDLGYSPVSFDVSALVKPGANQLQVVTRGWAGLERYEGKDVQIPTGAGNWFGIKDGGIPGEVHLRFHRGARIGMLRIVPHIAGPSCDVTTRVTAGASPWEGHLAAQVLSDDGRQALSAVKRLPVALRANEGKELAIKDIAAPSAGLWWPDSPRLCRLVLWLETAGGGGVACVRSDTFGFREVAVKGGRFHLNNRPIRLHGATELVMYRMLGLLKDARLFQDVQVKLFKRMNGVAFRSHMNPLPRRALELCDRNGLLVFPEFPNFPDVQRKGDESPYELPLYWKNLQREARGMIASRFNHPCIVGWSASNEGNGFGDWEREHLVPFVKSVDPTRLVMLSADVTPDIADQHNFAGMWWGTQTDFEAAARNLARAYPDSIVGNTEYGQFGPSKSWYGDRQVRSDSPEFQADLSLLLMEQTEALRRERFDIIMPYSYPRWAGKAASTGRHEDVGMSYHALRNALSPLGVSLDLSRRHAQTGRTLKVPVWVMSDSDSAKGDVKVRVCLLEKHPGYDWSGEVGGLTVLARAEFSTRIEPWRAHRETVRLRIPDKAGGYALAAAVWTKAGEGQAAAISLRPIRVYEPLPAPKRPRTVGVIEAGDRLARWLESRGHRVILPYGGERPDVIVIGDGRLYDTRLKQYGFAIANRVAVGGTRLVVLEQGAWDAKSMQENMMHALDRVRTAPLEAAVMCLFPTEGAARELGTYRDYRRLNGVEHVRRRGKSLAAIALRLWQRGRAGGLGPHPPGVRQGGGLRLSGAPDRPDRSRRRAGV